MMTETAERRPLALLVPALAVVFVAALDLTVIAPIMPSILFDLRINTAEADRYIWIVNGYLLAYTLTIPILGRLSDRVGRRTTFLVALAIFLIGSALCVRADSFGSLVAARTIQGLGGGAMVPVAMALVGDLLPPARRPAALGIVAAADTLGWVLGPIWGAAILQLFGGWRPIFLLNIPIGLLAGAVLVLAWRGPRRTPSPAVNGSSRDILGAGFLSVALVCINLGASSGSEAGGTSGQAALGATPNPLEPYQVPLLIAGAVALVVFVLVERRAGDPLVPLGLFRDRRFSAANTTNALVGAALMVAMANVPLLITLLSTESDSTLVSAELLSVFSLAMAAGSVAGGRAVSRLSYRAVTWAGLIVAAVGFFRMSDWPATIAMGRMAGDLAVTGLGFGLVIAPIGASAINAARHADIGIASALVIVMRLVGMTLGISALTAWAVGRLNRALAALPPLQQQAGESLADYFARQQQFATDQVIPLTLGVVRDTYLVAAIICLVAVLPAVLLPRRAENASAEPD